jgi:hypothetical protein
MHIIANQVVGPLTLMGGGVRVPMHNCTLFTEFFTVVHEALNTSLLLVFIHEWGEYYLLLNIVTIWTTLTYLSKPNLFFQFFKLQVNKDGPGAAIHYASVGTLKDLLIFGQQKDPMPMFYQQLTFPIQDLAFKRPMKCIYNGTEVTLYTNMNGVVADLVYLFWIFLFALISFKNKLIMCFSSHL